MDGDHFSGEIFPMVEGGNHSNGGFEEDAYLNSFPPGYRFKPLDHELISYLGKKVLKEPLPPNKIRNVELYKSSPDHLAAKYEPVEENTWYFFTPRDRKYKNGWRPNRAAGNGYWKTTTADKPIFSVEFPSLKIGTKKSLVYHTGKAPKGIKTDWIMHEYEVANAPKKIAGGDDMRLDDCVLCRIHRKPDASSKERAEELDKSNNCSISNNQQIHTLSSTEEALLPQPTWYSDNWVTSSNNQPISGNQQIYALSSKEEALQAQPTCYLNDWTTQNNNMPVFGNQQIHIFSSSMEEPLQPQPTCYPGDSTIQNNNLSISDNQQIPALSSKEESLQPQPTCNPGDSTIQNNNLSISDNQQIPALSSKEESLQPQPTCNPGDSTTQNQSISDNQQIPSLSSKEEPLQPQPTWYPDDWLMLNNDNGMLGGNGDFTTYQNEWFFTAEELLSK